MDLTDLGRGLLLLGAILSAVVLYLAVLAIVLQYWDRLRTRPWIGGLLFAGSLACGLALDATGSSSTATWFAPGGLVLLGVLSLLPRMTSSPMPDRVLPRVLAAIRAGFIGLTLVVGGASVCLSVGFASGLYNVEYVYNYSEKYLPTPFKLAGLWAGLSGSLLFWALLLCIFSAVLAVRMRRASPRHEVVRLEGWTFATLAAVALFFMLVTWLEDPFQTLPMEQRLRLADIHKVGIDESGNLLDGAGLNQQLVNYWFVIHPPTLYLGFVGWSIPFALCIAGLLTGEMGEYWRRAVRAWSMGSWIFLTSGIVLGGLWAYRQLGWGGYWAWDPVENASLLPWLTGTAFVHSLLVTERRDLLKGWSAFLLLLTFFLTILGTWMTRSGVVSSIHAFAGGPIGDRFLIFMFVVAGFSAFALAWRARTMRGTERIETPLCREAVFYANNFVLVLITAVVFVLSFLPKISHDWFASMRTDNEGQAYFQAVTPLFLLLLALTAVGPGLSWVRTTRTTLVRSFRGPLVATAVFLLLLHAFFLARGLAGSLRDFLPIPFSAPPATAIYPTGAFLGVSFFIIASVVQELGRGILARRRNTGESLIVAAARFKLKNHRRVGGYTVHLGLALVTVGIVASSMFRVKEQLVLRVGQAGRVGPYVVSPVSERVQERPMPGEPYAKVQVVFRVSRAGEGLLPVAHGEAPTDALAAARASAATGALVAELHPERRYYPKKDQWISEVTIHRRLLEDIYIYFSGRDAQGNIAFVVYLNPLMMLIYAGWIVMVLGGVFAALPLGARGRGGPHAGP